jgi:CheY-like chemotaxis protein
VQLAAHKAVPDVDVRIAGDGLEAVAYLEGRAPYDDRRTHPIPGLVILDLIMPRLDGFGVLGWIRAREDGTRRLPVVVLTSSVSPRDQKRALEMGASAFHTKPADLDRLGDLVRDIVARWLT